MAVWNLIGYDNPQFWWYSFEIIYSFDSFVPSPPPCLFMGSWGEWLGGDPAGFDTIQPATTLLFNEEPILPLQKGLLCWTEVWWKGNIIWRKERSPSEEEMMNNMFQVQINHLISQLFGNNATDNGANTIIITVLWWIYPANGFLIRSCPMTGNKWGRKVVTFPGL